MTENLFHSQERS